MTAPSTACVARLLLAIFAVSILSGCGPGDNIQVPSETASRELARLPRSTNVVLLVLDTLRADKLGCYGFSEDTSAEIDRLAEEGVLFTNVISQSPWTRPSIGSMITGLYPRTLGLYREKNERLPDDVPTLADVFKEHGFTTIGVTANPNINTVFGFAKSFDHYVDSNHVWDWMLDKNGKKEATVGSLMPATRVFAESIKAIRSLHRPPYYIQLDIMELHGFGAPARPRFQEQFKGHKNERYLQQLRQVSVDVGGFVREIAKLPGMQDTLFVLTSDHGEGLDDHPHVPMANYHGYVLYDSQLDVPLIFHHTTGRVGRGVVVEQRVRNLDLMATILDLMGWKSPPQAGRSLLPLFTDPDSVVDIPRLQVAETQFRGLNSIAVYGNDWRYFEHRRPWRGLADRELQEAGKADGAGTSVLAEHREAALPLSRHLVEWEAKYEKMPPTPIGNLSEETLRQLQAIGYID